MALLSFLWGFCRKMKTTVQDKSRNLVVKMLQQGYSPMHISMLIDVNQKDIEDLLETLKIE